MTSMLPSSYTPRTGRSALAIAVLSGLLGLAGATSTAAAQDVEVTGPLAGQPPVRHLRLYRDGRVGLTPFAGFTLQEPYRRSIFLGAHVDYHFNDWLGVGLWGAYAGVGIDTNLTDAIVADGVTTGRNRLSLPSRRGFRDQLGSIPGAVAAQVTLVPLRGKVALFQRLFMDTDLYVVAGLGLAFVEERANVTEAQCANAGTTAQIDQCYLGSQAARSTRALLAPTFGVGFNAYFTEYVGLSVEWRALPFAWNRTGTDESGDSAGNFPDGAIDADDRFFYLNHMFTFGLTFYLPGDADISE